MCNKPFSQYFNILSMKLALLLLCASQNAPWLAVDQTASYPDSKCAANRSGVIYFLPPTKHLFTRTPDSWSGKVSQRARAKCTFPLSRKFHQRRIPDDDLVFPHSNRAVVCLFLILFDLHFILLITLPIFVLTWPVTSCCPRAACLSGNSPLNCFFSVTICTILNFICFYW